MNPTPEVTKKPTKAEVFRSRLISTLVMWGITVGAFLSGSPWMFAALVLLLGGASVFEFGLMLKHNRVPRQPFWGIFAPLAYLFALFLAAGLDFFPGALVIGVAGPVIAVLGTFIGILKQAIEGRRSLTEIGTTLIGFSYLGWLFGMSYFVLFVPWYRLTNGAQSEFALVPGAWLGMYLIGVTKFTDMGAYLTGSMIGKNKMIPHISPGKTWEGFFGALVFAQLIGFLFYYFKGAQLFGLESIPMLIGMNFVIAILAVLGDLAGSVIKRALEVKDASHALPGIGGIFDLIDSLCFTAPALVIFLLLSSDDIATFLL